MKRKSLERNNRSAFRDGLWSVFVVVTALIVSPGTAGAFSIDNVTLAPASPVPAGTEIRMTVNITTPSAPAWLYQTTQLSWNGNQMGVDIYPTSGMLMVLGSLSETVSLGILPAGAYGYEVRLHPDFQVNWGTRTNRGSFEVSPLSASNTPPTVCITKPWDGQMFLLPTNITVLADTVDPDGYVWKVEFFADNIKIGEQSKYFFVAPPANSHIAYDLIWTNASPGRHDLTAVATDSRWATNVSAPVSIWVVTNLPPPVPVLTVTAPDPVASEGTNCCCWDGWPASAGFCGTNTATFVVRRAGVTNWSLRVFYELGGTASNGVDYSVSLPVATIPPGCLSAEIKIAPVDDNIPEPIETVLLTLHPPPAPMDSAAPYIVGFPNRAAAIIVDNDQPRPASCILPDGWFHFVNAAGPDTWYRIECSTDLINWTPLCTNLPADGALHFVDPDASDFPQHYYRAVPVPDPPAD